MSLSHTYTFRGGIHVEEYKNTRASKIEFMPAPTKVIIPCVQHIGAPAVPIVKKGDRVLIGQKIADVAAGLGCPVHSSVSGTVADIEEKSTPTGARMKFIVIDNDGTDEVSPDVVPFDKKLTDATPEEIIDVIRRAGISGMGGATFPTYAKISSARGKVDKLIVNCAECEPFITANHRLLLESPAQVVNGIKILLYALGLREGTIAIEDNKLNAINHLEKMLKDSKMIKVAVMKTKYPQGDERQLIYALTGKELPTGKLPADVGCVIFNAETCAAVYRAFTKGMPLVRRVITVDGDCITEPKNLSVAIGTPYSDMIEYCGGLKKKPKKIVNGGPMMGFAQWDINAPVSKGTSAILVFSEDFEAKYDNPPTCIHCGRCVANCPMHLMPNYLAQFSQMGDVQRAEEYGAMSCVECGSCSYNCPGHVQIVQRIRVAKGAIKAAADAKKAAAAASAKNETK